MIKVLNILNLPLLVGRIVDLYWLYLYHDSKSVIKELVLKVVGKTLVDFSGDGVLATYIAGQGLGLVVYYIRSGV